MKYYVYELIDPHGKTFYIGKGSGNRMYQHIKNVKRNNLPNNNSHLYHKIKQIIDSGKSIKYNKVFKTNSEQDAFDKEKQLISEFLQVSENSNGKFTR